MVGARSVSLSGMLPHSSCVSHWLLQLAKHQHDVKLDVTVRLCQHWHCTAVTGGLGAGSHCGVSVHKEDDVVDTTTYRRAIGMQQRWHGILVAGINLKLYGATTLR